MKYETWIKLLESEESADRVEAADHLPDVEPRKIIPHLITCLHDEEPLVRTCAADSLGSFRTHDVRQALIEFISTESDQLALAYGLDSLGAIGTFEDIPLLLSHLVTNATPLTRINTMTGLLLCVQYNTLLELTSYIDNRETDTESHKITGAAINSLAYLFKELDHEKTLVQERMKKHLLDEDLKAYRTTIDELLNS